MAEDNYPQAPKAELGNTTSSQSEPTVAKKPSVNEFPSADAAARLQDYEYHRKLFMGDHFDAFNIKIDDDQYNKAYSKLRYIKANFAGLISKIVADMLFSEPVTVKCPEGDQDFIDELWSANKMDQQCYESALSNSYNGDALFKLRIDKLDPSDTDTSIIIEDITPKIYFPRVQGFNVRAKPNYQELAWTFKSGDDTYLRKEIHTPGKIQNKVYKMEGNEIKNEVGLAILSDLNLKDEEEVKIDKSLIIHIPNWKTNDRFFGISDYYDLDTLFFAINNRLSKIDNILDKHSDPILMVPPGVLDEKGNVKKKALGVVEVDAGDANGGKPEYIVWDASLENAFKEIEKIVEFTYLMGEISPDVLGMGQGVSDSGRALKFKLMRTIAKVARKKLYYSDGLKEILYTAQLLAKAYGVGVNGVKLTKDPSPVEIEFQDGLPIDNSEQIDNESKAIDAGLTDKKSAIMRIFGVDEESAEQMLKDIEAEQPKVTLPMMKIGQNDKIVDPTTGKSPMPMDMTAKK